MSSSIHEAMIAVVGAKYVLQGEAIPERHCTDWFGLDINVPKMLVRPETPLQVSQTLALCTHHAQSVCIQGGLTGLVGGALAEPTDVALSLDRLKGIEEIDHAAATMTVLAGTTLQEVQEAAEQAGFLFAIDLGARGSCHIGGAIATNAGGNRVLRYGMMREQVLGIEVVLADGTIIQNLNKMQKNNAGYDLKQIFIGSEGTLGVITRAVLKLHPRPKSLCTAWCALQDYPSMVKFLRYAQGALAGTLSSFEVMWPDFHQLVSTRINGLRSPLPNSTTLQVLLEMEGGEQDRDSTTFAALLEYALEQGWLVDACIAQSQSQRQEFWKLREAVSEFPLMWHPYCGFDISLPIGQIGEFVEAVQSELRRQFPPCEHVHFGHIGDSNLHIGVHLNSKFGPFPHAQIDQCVYGVLRHYQGSVSAEHGIGTHKQPYLAYSRNEPEIKLMQHFKRTLDPKVILNRGKIFKFASVNG